MTDSHDLELVLKSHAPIVTIETREERRAVQLILGMQFRLGLPIYRWTITDGMARIDIELDERHELAEPEQVLNAIKSERARGLYILLDFHPYLDEPRHIRLLKDIALAYEKAQQTIVLLSHNLDIPPELRNFSARVELSLPDHEHLKAIVKDTAKQWSKEHRNEKVKADPESLQLLIKNLSGLTYAEARRVARSAIYDDGAITPEDLPKVMQAKYALLNKDGILHFELDTEKFSSVGGFRHLKAWLRQRQAVFDGTINNIDLPKGILLLGVQGCGKSLAAKAVAGVWGIPLLRLEFSALFNKYHGETERNLRESLKAAEVMAPCVLWIDELEKGISSSSHDGGTAKRVLGSLLTWMAEKKSNVFIVATANDIETLPPELVRKGRFDEIFFVDLPDERNRITIYQIHLDKRLYESAEFDLQRLAQLSEGFSGAEIEQSVVAAIYAAHAQQVSLTTNHIVAEIKRTKPLSVVMAERIAALRRWAQQRTVAVDG